MKRITILVLLLVPLYSFSYDDGKAGFSVTIKGETNPYKIFSIFLLPGHETNVKCETAISLESETISCLKISEKQWKIQAPIDYGTYKIKIINQANATMKINILVLTPISEKKGEYLNGYRIGHYPLEPLQGNPIYNRPVGFFEVSSDNIDMKLSPHFSIGQFLCKQESGFPKYLIIRERLILKLEYLLSAVNANNVEVETFGFISGYRTPFYNKQIKNVTYSRHVYGGAADIFIDQDKDGHMDDLNKDGIVNEKDVRIFYAWVEDEFNKSGYSKFKGGLGFYKKNTAHSGFIHVDVRGWKARW